MSGPGGSTTGNSRPESHLDISAAGRHVYDVRITHPSGAHTRHRVTVPQDMLVELDLSAAQEPLLVRVSLAVLLEHDVASLPDEFPLDEIARAVPDYVEQVLARI